MLESIKNLREYARKVIESPQYIRGESFDLWMFADEIEREIAEKYMKLPLDADGKLWSMEDKKFVDERNNVRELYAIAWVPSVHQWYLLNHGKNFFLAKKCRHRKERTAEDVLRDVMSDFEDADFNDDDTESIQNDEKDKFDTREKLEEDVSSWKANYRHMMKQRDELQAKVDKLKDELKKLRRKYFTDLTIFDRLQKKADTLEEENRLMRERLRSIADNDVTVFGMKLDEVRNLQVENAELREKMRGDKDMAELAVTFTCPKDEKKRDGEKCLKCQFCIRGIGNIFYCAWNMRESV